VRLALFRIYQQSLSNVIRHAEATQVWVRFSFSAEQTELEIE
jgi:signal transduction histidine kinase